MIDRDRYHLQTILKLIDLIRSHLDGVTQARFVEDANISDATAYRIQHIGEGAHRLSADLKKRHPDLPWQSIVGTRNFLAHEYENVSPARLWLIAVDRLPIIEAMCRAELGE